MTFVDIVNGQAVFWDANTFIYHFVPHPVLQTACQTLLERIGRKEIAGFTSADVLSDVAHRVMTLEAINRSIPRLWKSVASDNHPLSVASGR